MLFCDKMAYLKNDQFQVRKASVVVTTVAGTGAGTGTLTRIEGEIEKVGFVLGTGVDHIAVIVRERGYCETELINDTNVSTKAVYPVRAQAVDAAGANIAGLFVKDALAGNLDVDVTAYDSGSVPVAGTVTAVIWYR